MKQFNKLMLVSLMTLSIFLSSCKDEEVTADALGVDVLVVNEGNFSDADASLSGFNSSDGTVKLSMFTEVNTFSFNGLIQNVVEYDNNYYAVMALPAKVMVFDKSSLEATATIETTSGDAVELLNPFSFAAVGSKGYIADWGTYNADTFGYDNSGIIVVDLSTNTVTKKIDRAFKPQHLMAINDKIYITDNSSTTISVLDPATDEIETTIAVGSGPDKMVMDAGNKLWVLCNGGNLVRIDPSANEVEATISELPVSGFNEKMVINEAGDTLYFLAIGYSPASSLVYTLPVTATEAPAAPLITAESYYGIGIQDDILYLGDTNAFQGNGTVIRYRTDGTQIDTFGCGRGPNGFIFR